MSTRRLRLTVIAVLAALLGAWLVAAPAHAASGVVTGKVFGKLVGGSKKAEPEARVYLDKLNPDGFSHDNAFRSGETNAKGVYTIKNVPNGKYQVRIYPKVYGNTGDLGYEYYKNKWSPYGSAHISVSGGKVTLDDVLLEQPGWAYGVVRDVAGNPMTNTTVMVQDHKNSGGYGFATDSQGRYDTRDGDWTGNTIPGSYVVSASSSLYDIDDPVHNTDSKTLTIPANTGVKQDFVLKQLKTTVFTVKHSDGTPARHAPVGLWLKRPSDGIFEGAQFGPIETDGDGKFRLVEGRDYKLKFTPSPSFSGTDVAEYWDGPSGTGAYAYQDAAAIDWSGTALKRTHTVTLGPPPAIKQGKATVKGTPKLGAKLKAKTSGWPKNVKLRYEWEKNGTILKKATKKKLKVTAKVAKNARDISVRITATRSGDKAVDTVSQKKTVKLFKLKTSKPRIAGTAKVGKTLTVRPGAWGPGKVKLKVQWLKGNKAIKGATKKKLKITKALKGKKLRVRVTGTRPGYQTVVKTSAKTGKVKR